MIPQMIGMIRNFSAARTAAMLVKEFIQMWRDPLTLAMIVGIPVMQLFLFGYAINLNPKDLPTAISVEDPGIFARSIVAALKNSDYFDIVKATDSPGIARRMLNAGRVAFVIEIPVNFTRDVVRGANPQMLVEADATDPSASSYALAAINQLAMSALKDDLKGPLAARAPVAPGFEVVVHRLYNPESVTQYNVVPGLVGVILTMTMVLITSMAVTRERERGTFENLLAMPATPLEVMLGKIAPYVVVGYVQVTLVLLAARFVFHVPMLGSLVLLSVALVIFIIANLSLGYTFSTIAQNQLQAMQMTFFFFLPSILLSGFMFPFDGMPGWARDIGQILPLTHFLRIVRGIMLKDNSFSEIWPNLWPLILFMFAAATVALARFRRTLD
jgi:ABC-2 type transport system permease protein